MTGKRKEIGLFGDCQFTNLRPVNPYFPLIARRTKKKGAYETHPQPQQRDKKPCAGTALLVPGAATKTMA